MIEWILYDKKWLVFQKKRKPEPVMRKLKEQKMIQTYIAQYVKPNLVVKIACKDTWEINTNIYFASYFMSYVGSDFSDIFEFETS